MPDLQYITLLMSVGELDVNRLMKLFPFQAIRKSGIVSLHEHAPCPYRSMVQSRYRERAGGVTREETAKRAGELISHAMSHCSLHDNPHGRDLLLSAVMEVYREIGWVPAHPEQTDPSVRIVLFFIPNA